MIYKNETVLPFWQWPAFILFKSHSSILPIVFLVGVVLAAIYVLFIGKRTRMAFFILWFGIVNINNQVYPTLSGGDYLFQHLLFFAMFLSPATIYKSEALNDLDKAIHNFGMIALRVQVCLVYFLAAYTKLLDPDWLSGNAVNGSLMVSDYSLPFYHNGLGSLGVFLNWSVIAYQLLFPILVWSRTIKKWFLLIGVLQHLFIALVMGLPSFGFIMIIAYAVFYVPEFKTKSSISVELK